jgi:hypothetical protein
MKAISYFSARAMPVLPASGVRRRSWPRPTLAEALIGAQSRPRGWVIALMEERVTNSWRTELTIGAPCLVVGAEIYDFRAGFASAVAFLIISDIGGPICGLATAQEGVDIPFPFNQPHPFPVDPGS